MGHTIDAGIDLSLVFEGDALFYECLSVLRLRLRESLRLPLITGL